MDIEQLRKLIRELTQVLESSSISEIEIEEEGRRIRLTKTPPQLPQTYSIPMAALPTHGASPQAASGASGAAAADPASSLDSDLVTIDSPMVGVFYPCPAPGEAPFVSVGDTIEEDQTVCIVEAMKLMNEVSAKFRAEVVKILVENAEPVEFGQPLFAVRPL